MSTRPLLVGINHGAFEVVELEAARGWSARPSSRAASTEGRAWRSSASVTDTSEKQQRDMSQQQESLALQFEQHRPHLRAVAHRMLGSFSDADDAVQDAWLRISHANTSVVENLGGWLSTVVARIALNMLSSRRRRREQPFDVHVSDPVIDPAADTAPEHEALLGDSVGCALLVVLETLSPPARLAYVLHDMFAVPFGEIAATLERSPEAARQLASRARGRVRGAAAAPDAETTARREIVDAFLAAARDGDFDQLIALLDPDVVRTATRALACPRARSAAQKPSPATPRSSRKSASPSNHGRRCPELRAGRPRPSGP
jgi:RNA polymerase sigma-70 factor (ECF subfamily)